MSIKRLAILGCAALVAAGAIGAHAACIDCGTVTDVQTVKKEGEGSGAGMVIGGIAGGVLGHQVGSGRGKDVATVAGVAGGAYVGNEVEKKNKAATSYVVRVKMEDGSNRSFTYSAPTSYRAGDRVKIVDRKLVRQ
ncbi:MAG TPA: glycine zipper 2TM domain-containing protein [Usitatibacter sp.]